MNRSHSRPSARQLIRGRCAERSDDRVIALQRLRIVIGRLGKHPMFAAFDADDFHVWVRGVKAELICRQGLRTGVDKKINGAERRLLCVSADCKQQRNGNECAKANHALPFFKFTALAATASTSARSTIPSLLKSNPEALPC